MTLTLKINGASAIVDLLLLTQGEDFLDSAATTYLECGEAEATRMVKKRFKEKYRAKLKSPYCAISWIFEFDCDEDLIAFKLALL